MKKKRKEISIITVDIYQNTNYKFDGRSFTPLRKARRSKKDTVVSYLASKNLSVQLIELSPHIPSESISSAIEDKVYEELNLDPAVEYGIYPIKTNLQSKNIKYQVLIVEKDTIKKDFAKAVKSVKYIDYLFPAPLLFKTLYKNNNLNTNNSDMFIYFGEYDAFVTFYHRGEYLYSKSIKYSLNDMYDRFCQLAQEVPLSKNEFKALLENDGLKDSDSAYKELLIKVINECFLKINDILIYTKRAYELSNIKTAYIGFSWGYITGIENYITNYLSLEGKALTLLYSNKDPKDEIDPIHYLMAHSAIAVEKGLDLINLTPYPKPEPFAKRPAGKIIFATLAIVFIFLAPVIYDYFIGASLQAKNLVLRKKEAKLTAEANRYKTILKKKKEEIKALEQAITKIKALYMNKKNQLDNVYNKKFHYQLKSEQLALITDIIKNHDIKSRFIEIDDTLYKIEVESENDKDITSFIKDIIKHFNRDISRVDIKDIKYYPKEALYKGVVKIEFMKE